MPKDRKPAPKKRKVAISFDEKSRSEYITGFRRRKQERRVKAQSDIAKKLKQKVREQRNKRRKETSKKAEDILSGVYGLEELAGVENVTANGDVTDKDGSGAVETVEFENHQVFVNSEFNFEDAGYMGASVEDEENIAEEPKKTKKDVIKEKKVVSKEKKFTSKKRKMTKK